MKIAMYKKKKKNIPYKFKPNKLINRINKSINKCKTMNR